ncbi:hypothetical protein [Winogradskyella marincola]|uniref:Uncharacterized protein n=1 Tax=Winogradskyella marincola TaxID=3037795 RepID=A0ABT6G2K4_9FLAO|nr:hypothetical protein [Winogradskyella sp. YYF002]MDG4716258.1 hypothetical protein [Winogradskyella sp. YYF002]
MCFVGNVLYYQLNIDYIIETYCVNKEKPELQCNGKCHLAKQLSATKTTDKNGKAILNLSDSFFPVFSQEFQEFKTSFILSIAIKDKIVSPAQNYKFSFEQVHFKPPIA